jgi:hypothetical protein
LVFLLQEKSLISYLVFKFKQLRSRGRLIIRDVVGPEKGNSEILLWLNSEDGKNDEIFADKEKNSKIATVDCLNSLSTASRFRRFAIEFLQDEVLKGKLPESAKLHFAEVVIVGVNYFKVSSRHATEFLMKKDYSLLYLSLFFCVIISFCS